MQEIKTETARDWAKSRGYQYFETSAKSGANVAEAFKFIFEGIHGKAIDNRAKFLY